jgi:hypothetical protein
VNNTGFSKGDILVPNVECMSAWSVIACDQYTSQPQYWRDVENFVKTKPSTLNMMVPEIRFASDDLDQRICSVNRAMRTYLRRHMFYEVHDYIYSRRVLSNGKVRCGLVGVIDLEQYEFHPGSQTTVRATEGVIQSLIEPRLAIRDLTPLEVSHTMLLIDDRENTVFASLEQELDQMQLLYSFDLMMGSGSISGYLVTPEQSERIDRALTALATPEEMQKKYGITDKGIFVYAVGDGNNSIATAKLHYDNLKRTLSPQKLRNHPARYTLSEIVNLHDDSFEFEPINRVLFGVDTANFLHQLSHVHRISYSPQEGQQYFDCVIRDETKRIWIADPSSNVVTGTVQNFIDHYIREFSGKVDYVHGENIVRQLAAQTDNVGILFPSIPKESLFETILIDGILPRKTFSMGTAADKRFYLECRKIKP